VIFQVHILFVSEQAAQVPLPAVIDQEIDPHTPLADGGPAGVVT